MAKQFKKGQVSAKRAYEIADSLRKDASVGNRVGDLYSSAFKNKGSVMGFKGSKLQELATKNYNQANYNHSKADRIEKAADAAMNKAKGRDIPLPSSDKLF